MTQSSFSVTSKADAQARLTAQFASVAATTGLWPLAEREGEALYARFARHYERLSRLSRRTRRALQRRWKRSLSALALLLALGQAPALAADIDVDGTTCTLINAITAANSDTATGGCPAGSGADTLNLVANSTHTLTAVNNSTPYGPTGLPVIGTEITIEGHGSTIKRDSADPKEFRIFAINSSGNLTLNETTVSGGATEEFLLTFPATAGGGVLNYGGTLTLTNSTVSGNSANSRGGGVFNRDGTLTLTDSTVSGNSADFGGGVDNFFDGTLTLTNSTVSGNSAGVGGGGMLNLETLTLTNSTVSGNRARYGGGVFTVYGTATLTNTTVSGNRADLFGGGVYNLNPGTATLTNTTVSGNSTDISGGGVFNASTLTLTDSTVSGNSAIGAAGVGNVGTLTLTNSTVSGNRARYGGGGVGNSSGTATLANSTVSGNSASLGGGVTNSFGGTTILVRSLISGNTAPNSAEVYHFGSGGVSAGDFNLLGHSGLSNAQAFYGFTPGASDITATSDGTDPTALAALLDTALMNNGGPTQTHALVAGSPAIDAVTDLSCPPPDFDQRGVARPQPAGGNCDIGSFEVMAAPAPDLAVSKTDSPDPVVVSDHLTYTIEVNNAGQGDATGVLLADTLPASVAFVSVNPSDSCGEVGGEVTCDLGDMASGDSATVTLVVRPTATGTITNSVSVQANETDDNPGNNTDTEDTTINALLCNGRVPTRVGTPGNDANLRGTNGPDVIHGLGGNDTISGLNGDDVICGGEGNDTVSGNNGNDRLFGENGTDTLNGNNGKDALDGGTGTTDTCNGGSGADTGANCEPFNQ